MGPLSALEEFSAGGPKSFLPGPRGADPRVEKGALSDGAGLARCYDCAGSGASVTCSPAAAFASQYGCPGYRLPTEAEWEHAARAGTTTATYAGDLATLDCPNGVLDPIAWTYCNAGDRPHAAGGRAPNGWGLYDVLGNVWEWCHDWSGDYPAGAATDPWGPTTGTNRVVRGGSWINDPGHARAAVRGGCDPGGRHADVGFRPSRSEP